MMTMERASELVKNAASSNDQIDLFAHFEMVLNPYTDEEKSANWMYMFAEMCGFNTARKITIV